MNAKEYRKHIGVTKTKYVLDWIEKGYLPNVVDPETGVIDIPADMPKPYKSNGNTKRISKLIEQIIEAADMQQSIYPQMFRYIREDTFTRTIESLIECNIISRQYSSTGAPYYELGVNWKQYDLGHQEEIIKKICDGISVCANITQIVTAVWPLIMKLEEIIN